MEPTRSSSDWFKLDCPNTLIPCGNPECADETMRAKDQLKTGLGETVSDEMIAKVRERAEKCVGCNLKDRQEFITNLFNNY